MRYYTVHDEELRLIQYMEKMLGLHFDKFPYYV